MNQVFVNEAFTKAIDDYLKNADNVQGIIYNSFLVVVVRMLVCIYSELDIVNPLVIGDEELLYKNLTKFGYSRDSLNIFFSNLQLYYDISQKNQQNSQKEKNPYFEFVQKDLIDMFIVKKVNFYLTEEEVKTFYDLLYTPFSKNPLRVSYNFLMCTINNTDVMEIDNYFKIQMRDNIKVIKPQEKHYLNVKAYEILNYSMDDLNKMDSNELERVNHQVYDYFKIRENAINKEYLLEKAIEAIEREKNKVTSGNGYVDILLVMSVICTIIMVVGILTFVVL
ncbi:MAG TPA: hypothetical protein IAB40_06775 [Candidatus Onthocola stercoravium]|nr:hypothetical protein [Candidatus Onthocola stercoravium]